MTGCPGRPYRPLSMLVASGKRVSLARCAHCDASASEREGHAFPSFFRLGSCNSLQSPVTELCRYCRISSSESFRVLLPLGVSG